MWRHRLPWCPDMLSSCQKRHDGRTPNAMAKPTLLPDPTCLHLQLLDASDTAITAVVTTTSEEAECPLCRKPSGRLHSRYVREVERWWLPTPGAPRDSWMSLLSSASRSVGKPESAWWQGWASPPVPTRSFGSSMLPRTPLTRRLVCWAWMISVRHEVARVAVRTLERRLLPGVLPPSAEPSLNQVRLGQCSHVR